jgi:hypothetical protein
LRASGGRVAGRPERQTVLGAQQAEQRPYGARVERRGIGFRVASDGVGGRGVGGGRASERNAESLEMRFLAAVAGCTVWARRRRPAQKMNLGSKILPRSALPMARSRSDRDGTLELRPPIFSSSAM